MKKETPVGNHRSLFWLIVPNCINYGIHMIEKNEKRVKKKYIIIVNDFFYAHFTQIQEISVL